MAKKATQIIHANLACGECGRRNYHTKRNKLNTQKKLQLSKYCKWCRQHSLHKEV